MNESDSEKISGLLEEDGYEQTTNQEEADVVLLNTCCIRENADNKLYGALGNLKKLKENKPEMQIVVSGCLAQKDRELIQSKAKYVDVVFGTHNVHRVTELLSEAKENGPITEIWEETDPQDLSFSSALMPAKRESDFMSWLTIQVGCDNSCAFCIVPSVRGKEISRPFDEIVEEARRIAAQGVTEITLLGQNVNSYGRDLALQARKIDGVTKARPMFADLLRAVGNIDGIKRVRYTSPHPKDMTLDVFQAMDETPSVVPHLHFPLQSGSDSVLKAMHRGYTGERFLEKISLARDTIEDLAVTTDIIVGFPGETEQDFEDTLKVVAEAEFDAAYTFVFSPRPGTEAAEMEDQFCDPGVVRERYDRLRTVVQRSSELKHQARVGRVEEVVVEGVSKKDPEMLTGRTVHNKLVHFSGENIKPGTYANVKITNASYQYLNGEFIEVTDKARHRTRLDVFAA